MGILVELSIDVELWLEVDEDVELDLCACDSLIGLPFSFLTLGLGIWSRSRVEKTLDKYSAESGMSLCFYVSEKVLFI
jgi:hypothetical protein